MNHRVDKELLADVLAEASPSDFRAALLGTTLRMARTRRRLRQARRVILLLAIIAAAAVFVARRSPPPGVAAQPAAVSPPTDSIPGSFCQVVFTRPLPAAAIVTTQAFSNVVTDGQFSPVAQVSTTPGGCGEIDDRQLLALVAGQPAALIRTGPHSEVLVVAASGSEGGAPAN
jgi:hypothetical protein